MNVNENDREDLDDAEMVHPGGLWLSTIKVMGVWGTWRIMLKTCRTYPPNKYSH
jgi:hypothetical protein